MLIIKIHTCPDPFCKFCEILDFLLLNERVIKFMDGDSFKASKMPVDMAQCDQIMGFGNFSYFTREVFGIDPNVFMNHVLGDSTVSVVWGWGYWASLTTINNRLDIENCQGTSWNTHAGVLT